MTARKAVVTRADSHRIQETHWGRLEWMVSGQLGNSDTMTVGRCYIDSGHENPHHYHPNCDEVLHVIEGTIEQLCDDEVVVMGPGDAVSIPAGIVHNARNVGDGRAVLLIAFSSPDRQTVGE